MQRVTKNIYKYLKKNICVFELKQKAQIFIKLLFIL